jgi:methylmalonyl-CoA mutase
MDVDAFAGRLSFFFAIGMNFFMEAAKLRAARLLWHRIMSEFGAKKPESLMLRTHCQTSGVSLQEQDPYNNVVRTAYEAMAAVLGGTQSLHTNAFDEAIALPTDFRPHRAQHPADPAGRNRRDPRRRSAGGQLLRRKLTAELAEKAWALIEEVEAMGGMTKAVPAACPSCGSRKPPPAGRHDRPRRGGDRRRQQVPPGQGRPDRHPRHRQRRRARVPDRPAARIRATATAPPATAALAALEQAARGRGRQPAGAAVEAARARATVGRSAWRWKRSSAATAPR